MVPAVLLDRIRKQRPELAQGQPDDQRQFTGERFLPGFADGSTELYHVHRYAFALPFVVGQAVLDISCGEGYGASLLAHVCGSVIAVDKDVHVIDQARLRYVRSNLSFRQGCADAFPVDDDSVDAIVSFETIEHLADHDSFWREVSRVLRQTGTLIISSPDREFYNRQRTQKNPFHVRELTPEELTVQLQTRFRQVELFKQEIVFGSLIRPAGVSPSQYTAISVDPETSVLAWNTNGHANSPYFIAIASNSLPFLPEASLYTGRYPADAMASLAGGITERDALLVNLRRELDACRSGGQEPNGSTNFEDKSQVTFIKERDDALLEASRLKETLVEQDKVILALQALVAEGQYPEAPAATTPPKDHSGIAS
jgi:2-polyprenyl-3-methyl-5-hydroxy-6-metoxy-1,4-benzoquinol methylase